MQRLRQDLRLRQELTLQPQQILRSELLQMPALELEMRIKEELEENPFLEEIDPTEDLETPDETPTETADLDEGLSAPVTDDETPEPENPDRNVDWEDFLNDAEHWEYRPQQPRLPAPSELPTEIPQPFVPSLSERLTEQLHLDDLTPDEAAVGEEIIGNLNPDGFLEISLEEIAALTGKPLETVARVHARIMEYDPPGIAARNLRECLLVQLRRREPRFPLAEQVLTEHWDDFINKRYEVLAEKLKVSEDEIRRVFEVVARLNPKPGEGSLDETQNYVVPDLVVTRVGEDFEVYLAEGDTPNFRISPRYRDLFLSRKGADKQVREYLTRKFESARWFLNAVHQRRTTMLRVMRAIVDRQRDFFLKGPAHLKPMILDDIAQDVGMNISTISRVTNGKFVQTDQGIFELKYFFSERMKTEDGEDVSNRVIKARLKELIDGENKRQPLSDQELTEVLNREGFQIKRRTVAKYREQMRIPVKRLRRQI